MLGKRHRTRDRAAGRYGQSPKATLRSAAEARPADREQHPEREAGLAEQDRGLGRGGVVREPRDHPAQVDERDAVPQLLLGAGVVADRHELRDDREDLALLLADVLVEQVEHLGHRAGQPAGGLEVVRGGRDGGGSGARAGQDRVDHAVVVGQLGEVDGGARGGGDHRPDDPVLVVVVGVDLVAELTDVLPQRGGPGRREDHGTAGDPVGQVGHRAGVRQHRPVHQAVAGEVHLRLAVAARGHRGGGGAGHREPPGALGRDRTAQLSPAALAADLRSAARGPLAGRLDRRSNPEPS